jgi:hypothetical protein
VLHGVGGHATHSSISLTGILAPEGLHSAAASAALRACQAGARRLLEPRVDNLEAVATRAICGVALPEGNLPSVGKVRRLCDVRHDRGKRAHGGGISPLLGRAGFGLKQVIPTSSDLNIIEALPD